MPVSRFCRRTRWASGLILAAVTGCGSTVQLGGLAQQGTTSGLSAGDQIGLGLPGTVRGTTTGQPRSGTSGSETSVGTTGAAGSTEGASAAALGTDGGVPTIGGPRVTAPISVGFLAGKSVSGVIAAIGGSGGPDVDSGDAIKYMVGYYNAHGGIDGRQIKPVYDFIDPSSSDYETQAQKACADFTQDHHVAAALSYEANYYSTTYTPCIDKANIPDFIGLAGGVDDQELASYKTLISISAPTINRRFTALFKGLTDNGFLTPKHKIGVIVEDCPFNTRAYAKTVAPLLQQYALPFVKRTVNCAQGFGDAAAIIAAFGNAVLPFKAEGVDRVMFVSGFEQLGAGTFEKQAKSQNYSPSYALTSTSSVGVNDMGMPAASLPRVEAVGWSAVRDENALQPGSAATQRCRAMWKAYPPAQKRVNRKDVELICEGFFSLEAALKKSGGLATAAALLSAVAGLGTSYDSPTALEGETYYSASHRDGPRLFAVTTYKNSCSCFSYDTKPAPLA